MNVEIICVGTELLLGEVLDTNSFYLAKILAAYGLNHYHRSVVGDNPERMMHVIETAFQRGAETVILCGGLGPTQDDVTKQVAAEYFGLPLVEHGEQRQLLDQKYARLAEQKLPASVYRQAAFPEGSLILPNDNGTAPGCLMSVGTKRILVLPGPPKELELMVEKYVRPLFAQWQEGAVYSRVLNCYGLGESVMEARLADIDFEHSPVTCAPYASEGTSRVRISVKMADEQQAQTLLNQMQEQIEARIGEAIYSVGEQTLPEVVSEQLGPMKLGVIDFSETSQLFWQLQATPLARQFCESLSGTVEQLYEQLQVQNVAEMVTRFCQHFGLAGVISFTPRQEQPDNCQYRIQYYTADGTCQWETNLEALVPYYQQPERTVVKLAGMIWQHQK